MRSPNVERAPAAGPRATVLCRALGAAALAMTALASAAEAGDPGADRDRQPPLDPELVGRADRAVGKAADGANSLRALAGAEPLDGLPEPEVFDQLAVLQAPGERGGRVDDEGSTIDEHRPLNPDGRILVNNVAGTIQVGAWDRNEVAIGGTLGSSIEKLDISGDPASLSIAVRIPKHAHGSGDTALKLRVPAEARVELESVSADVAADGLRGPVKVDTVSGDVRLALNSPEIAVQTVSGDLKLRAPARQSRISSVSGDLHLAGLQGRLSVETVSGNVDLEGGRFSELRLKSISGDLRLEVALDDQAQIAGETLSGEITLIVPTTQTGTALLKSFSGEASCDGAQMTPVESKRKREYTWGDGRGARIELSSFSGDIHVQKK